LLRNFVFDAPGSTAKNYVYYPGTNKVQNVAGDTSHAYKYDPYGNMLSSASKGDTMSYDPFTEMTTTIKTSGGDVETFEYDGSGNRILRADNYLGVSSSSFYILGTSASPLTLKSDTRSNAADERFVYGPDGLIAENIGLNNYFTLRDHIGSIRAVVAGSGNTLSSEYDYTPLGAIWRSTVGTDVPYKFTGQESDVQTGLDNFKARMYDPDLGIFYAIDPHHSSNSPYGYAGGNPIMFNDPTGMYTDYSYTLQDGGTETVTSYQEDVNGELTTEYNYQQTADPALEHLNDLTDQSGESSTSGSGGTGILQSIVNTATTFYNTFVLGKSDQENFNSSSDDQSGPLSPEQQALAQATENANVGGVPLLKAPDSYSVMAGGNLGANFGDASANLSGYGTLSTNGNLALTGASDVTFASQPLANLSLTESRDAGLTLDAGGNVFGTTQDGGGAGGTVGGQAFGFGVALSTTFTASGTTLSLQVTIEGLLIGGSATWNQ
jgi:RHS repeat-associated protein